MKAIKSNRYGGVNVLTVSDIATPKINTRQLLIKVHACSVNPVDWKIRRGKIAIKTGIKPPKVLGSDFSGTVESVGSKITDYKIGDRVWGKVDSFKGGAYAGYIKVSEQNISLIPQGLTDEEAASIPNVGLTAFQALMYQAKIKPEHHVLINGASGGVGLMAIQIAKALGCTVTAVCSEKNHDLVKKIGADHVIDYTKEDVTQNKNIYDVFFDSVANCSLFKVKNTLKAGGVYLRTVPSLETSLFGPLLSFLKLKTAKHIMVQPSHSNLTALKKLIEAQKMVAVIDTTYPLEEVAKAHIKSETGRVVGKLVLNVS